MIFFPWPYLHLKLGNGIEQGNLETNILLFILHWRGIECVGLKIRLLWTWQYQFISKGSRGLISPLISLFAPGFPLLVSNLTEKSVIWPWCLFPTMNYWKWTDNFSSTIITRTSSLSIMAQNEKKSIPSHRHRSGSCRKWGGCGIIQFRSKNTLNYHGYE